MSKEQGPSPGEMETKPKEQVDTETKTKLQEEANTRAFDLKKSILQQAKLWERYADSSETQAALQPTLDRLRQSGNLLDYLALKSLNKFSTRIDVPHAAMSEDPAILERARTEILTAEQNQELDSRLEELGEETTLALAYQADKAGVSVEEFLVSKPDFLVQANKNALDFRSGAMAELSPEDRSKAEEQVRAKLSAIKTYNRLREENLERTDGMQADARGQEYQAGMEAGISSELQLLKSEGKIAEYLALKGTDGPDFMSNPRNLDGFGVKDLVEIAAKEDKLTVDNVKAVLTTKQNLTLDQRLSQAK